MRSYVKLIGPQNAPLPESRVLIRHPASGIRLIEHMFGRGAETGYHGTNKEEDQCQTEQA